MTVLSGLSSVLEASTFTAYLSPEAATWYLKPKLLKLFLHLGITPRGVLSKKDPSFTYLTVTDTAATTAFAPFAQRVFSDESKKTHNGVGPFKFKCYAYPV